MRHQCALSTVPFSEHGAWGLDDVQATDTLQGRVPLDAQLEAAGLQALARLRGAQPLPPMRALRVLATVLLRLAGRGSASLDAAALEAVRVLPEAMCLPAAQPAPSNVSTFARALPVDAQQPGSSAGDETGQLCDHPAITWLGDALQQRLKVANSTALPTVVNHASAANHSQITPSARRLAFSPDGSRLAFAIDRGVQVCRASHYLDRGNLLCMLLFHATYWYHPYTPAKADNSKSFQA